MKHMLKFPLFKIHPRLSYQCHHHCCHFFINFPFAIVIMDFWFRVLTFLTFILYIFIVMLLYACIPLFCFYNNNVVVISSKFSISIFKLYFLLPKYVAYILLFCFNVDFMELLPN